MSRKNSKPYIHGKNLELLKQLIQNGYVYTGKNGNRLRFLQKIFPSIKRAQYKNRSIYYLEDKNKIALQELIRQNSSRIISYQDLGRACQVFHADIPKTEKRCFFGKSDQNFSEKKDKYIQTKIKFIRRKMSNFLIDFCVRKY